MNLDTHELAWAAGFFDGEGSTHRRIDGSVILSIDQKGNIPLIRFKNAIGNKGGISYHSGFRRDIGETQAMYKLSVGNFQDVQFVMALLWKYLCPIKRQQYKRHVIEHLKSCKKNNLLKTNKAINQRYYTARKEYLYLMRLQAVTSQECVNPFKS